MKISDLMYQEIVLSPIIKYVNENKDFVDVARKEIPFTKNQFISFVWFIARKAKVDIAFLYNQNLNDTHIETALKKALDSYK